MTHFENVKPLRRFFGYYGAKNRLAKHYPEPLYANIIEAFAGSASYALHYFNRNVTLVDVDPSVIGVWSYLIKVKPSEVMRLPTDISDVDGLPRRPPQGAKGLIGYWFNQSGYPSRVRSGFGFGIGRKGSSWEDGVRQRIADQVRYIRHWKVRLGSYADVPNRLATWFVDPPYQNVCGRSYRFHKVDFDHLGSWCRHRLGQVIVCEQAGADWLPFQPLKEITGVSGKVSTEVMWGSERKKAKRVSLCDTALCEINHRGRVQPFPLIHNGQ